MSDIWINGQRYTQQEYDDYLTSLGLFKEELDRHYDEVGSGVYIKREVPGVPDQYTFEQLSDYPFGETPGEEVPTGEATTRRLDVTVREGINTRAGDYQIYSTGPVRPTVVNGWVNAMAAVGQDGSYASHTLSAGSYTSELVCSGFTFDVPAEATIKGIEVKVVRRKL